MDEYGFYTSQGLTGSLQDRRYDFYRRGKAHGKSVSDYEREFFLDLLDLPYSSSMSLNDAEYLYFAQEGASSINDGFRKAWDGLISLMNDVVPIAAFPFDGVLTDAKGGAGLNNTPGTYDVGVNGQAVVSALAHGRSQAVTGAATIMAWVRVTVDTDTDVALFGIWSTVAGSGNSHFTIYNRRTNFGTPLVLQALVRIGGVLAPVAAPSRLSLNEWHHVAATHDESFMTRVYIDGIEVGSRQGVGPISSGATFLVRQVGGWTDDMQLFDKALTKGQILNFMNQAAA